MLRTFIVLFIIVISSLLQPQNWRKAAYGTFPALNKVHFIDENTGYCVGNYGTIIKSVDGGQTWVTKISNTTNTLEDICFINNSKGFATGDNRTILITTDGGDSWESNTVLAVPDGKASIRRISFADENNGWIIATITGKGWILHTNDGGENWNLDYTTNVQLIDLAVYDKGYAIVTGKNVSSIFYSRDGINWNKSSSPSAYPPDGVIYSRSDVRCVFMVTENLAYTTGWGSPLMGGQPTIYLKSTDGGATWTYLLQDPVNRTFDNLFDIYFKDEEHGIAVGGGGVKGTLVTITTDGGQNWKVTYPPFGSSVNSVCGLGDKLWMCGDGGLIAASSDFGSSWNLLTPVPNHSLYSIEFPTSDFGIAAGFNGVLLKTSDGGNTWKGSYLENSASVVSIHDLHFLNQNIGFSAHSYRTVSKTTDGGNTWNVLIPDTNDALVKSNGLYFVNENLGFVVGQHAVEQDTIYKTTDGGKTWATKGSVVRKELKDVKFFDETHGVMVGSNLKILYTNNGGENWNEPIINNIPDGRYASKLKSVAFADKNLIYACGEGTLLRSTDGGASWDFIQMDVKTILYGICFHNSSVGYAVGEKYILQTTDSGYTWNNIIDSTVTGILYDVDTDEEGYVWICGANGNIFTNKDKTSSIEYDAHMHEFSLSQNYPNPFNPSTTITYKIPEPGFVELKIFDVLGREVQTLVSQYQNSGIYNVSFYGNTLTSGTYFYSIKYDNKIRSGKMCLIK